MTTLEAPTNVIAALARVMGELPGIGKSRHPSEGGGGISYAYRGIEEITAEAQTLCARYGVVFVPKVLSKEIVPLTVNGKPWTDTIMEVEYTIYGPGGVKDRIVAGPFVGIGRDNSDKGANKSMTQVFKYALLQTLMISDRADDTDGKTVEADAVQAIPPGLVYAVQAKRDLFALVTAAGLAGEVAKEHAKGIWATSGLPDEGLISVQGAEAMLAGARKELESAGVIAEALATVTPPANPFMDGIEEPPTASGEAPEIAQEPSKAPEGADVPGEVPTDAEPAQDAPAEPLASPASVQQIKILQKTLKVTDDSYRGTLETSYGKRSSKELTETQALEVIARMRVKADALEEGVRG
jgi:hypothetical protein